MAEMGMLVAKRLNFFTYMDNNYLCESFLGEKLFIKFAENPFAK